jgi:hypothetical protein
MAYTIYKADGTAVSVIEGAISGVFYDPNANGTGKGIGQQLIGKSAINYGAPIAQNFLQLTENFCGTVMPSDTTALQGQLWFNKLSNTSGDLYVRNTNTASGGMANWTKLLTQSALGASSGSTLVGFIQSGTGSQQRTTQAKLRDIVSVLDFGADPTGVSDSHTAFTNAWARIKTTGGSILIPEGTYLLNSQWALDIDTTAPHNYEINGYGAIIKTGAAVTSWAIRVYGSYNNHGLKIEGLQFDQRNNVNVNGCILAQGTSNLRIVKCSAELALNKSGWAAVQLQDLTPGNGDTGCFWTLIDGLTTRARTGVDLFVAQTTATTTLTSGSNLMTVAAVTGTIVVGYTVFDLAGAPVGGQTLLPVGTVVTAQVSGTPGGAGVYRLSSNSLGSTTTDTVAFAKYADFGVRMSGSQNATKIINCSFASVVDAIRIDPGSSTPAPGWPSGDVGHANGLRVERNDFEGVTNAIKVNTDAPAVIMPVGLMAKSNRVEATYSYFNIGSNTPFIADAATFTGSIAAGTNILTVTGCTGTIAAGSVVRGAGVLTPAIVQAYGTGGTTGTGGNGTYALALTHADAISATPMTISGVRRLPDHSTPPNLGPDYAVTGSSDNYIINPNAQIVYAAQSTYYADSFSQAGGPSEYTIITENSGNNLILRNLSWQSTWDTAHLVMGQQHYWTDQSGNLRTKSGTPKYDTDGTIVGLQGIPTSAPLMNNLFVNPWFNVYGSAATTGVWGASGGPPVGCSTTPVGVVWSATPPSPCPNNPTGQAARIQSIGTTISNGLIISLNNGQLTTGDTVSCGIWILSPNLSTAKAVVYGIDGSGATGVIGSNTAANTWQFIKWSQPVNNLATAVVYVGAGTGASFTATVPYGSNIMTVTSVTGTIAAGAALIGGPTINGIDIHPFGATISIQPYGTSGTTGTGGAGTYALNSVLTREVTAQQMNTVTGYATNTVVWAGAFHMTLGAYAPQNVADSFEQDEYGFEVNQQGDVRMKQRLLIGSTSPAPGGAGGRLQIYGNATTGANFLQRRFSVDATGPTFALSKTRGATATDATLVQNGDSLGTLLFQGSDGVASQSLVAVGAYVDGVASAGSVPTMLTIATSSPGSVTGSERIRFRANGTTEANGTIKAHAGTSIPAGGTTGAGLEVSNSVNFGIYFGSGAPTLTAAKGSLYLRSDGTTTNNRIYVNIDGGNSWTAVITAA